MYRRPKFLERLLEIRREMALEADYDVDLFVGITRNGVAHSNGKNVGEFHAVAEPMDAEPDIPPVLEGRREIRKA